jgi:hypothetical protein
MKKIIGIGLVTAALLAGCGGAPAGTTEPTSATGATGAETVATTAPDINAIPTSETGAGEAADTAPDATAAANATAVNEAGVTAGDATAVATSETSGNTTGQTSGTAAPTSATGDTSGSGTAAPTSATGDTSGSGTGTTGTAAPTSATGDATGSGTAAPTSATGSTSGQTSGQASGSTAIEGYQPAGIPELGLSFQVPDGWEQVNGENAWSPAGVDTPRVGVESAEITPDWMPSSFLPEGATVRSTQSMMLPGGQAMFYTVENDDGTAESHAIIRSGTTAYDFYARAESLQDLRTIEPVLNDIVGSVQMGGV